MKQTQEIREFYRAQTTELMKQIEDEKILRFIYNIVRAGQQEDKAGK